MSTKYDVEKQRLRTQIEEWNSNRLDLFALSLPNENLEFFGVMRFFYQDDADKVSTKCVRVASTATTRDVMAILIEKFRPDMRMLSSAQYALYEVHVNGEERPLRADELPLLVQLNWGKDDREGRFLLKKENEKTALPQSSDLTVNNVNRVSSNDSTAAALQGSFKRKLSKREKKDLKKKEKEQKSHANVSCEENNVGIAQRLYSELPESSFTRSISNPELVMRKRRQLKLEKKLQQIRSNDGGPDSGGTLKIYGSDINPDVPYKTLLLSVTDNAAHVVRETLEKYGISKEDPFNFCLVQVLIPPDGPDTGKDPKECVLNDDDCPLAIILQHPPSKGTIMFQLRRSTNSHKKKSLQQQQQSAPLTDRKLNVQPVQTSAMQPQKVMPLQTSAMQPQQAMPLQTSAMHPQQVMPMQTSAMQPQQAMPLQTSAMHPQQVMPMQTSAMQPQQVMPLLLEVDIDGKEVNNGKRCRILPNITEIGSERVIKPNFQYIQLQALDVLPRHCIITNTESSVTVKPLSPNAIIVVNGSRITQTTRIRHGDFVKFGATYNFVLIHPASGDTKLQQQLIPVEVRVTKSSKMPNNSGDLETTFDVDGHVETIVSHVSSSSSGVQDPDDPYGPPGYEPDLLPAMLTYKDEAEDQLLASVINDVNGAAMQFRLAPAYVLYLTLRSRASWLTRPDLTALQRDERVNICANKIVRRINHLIRDHQSNPGALSFWLANASELLNFIKQDVDIGQCTFTAQNQLAETIQMTFSLLIDCFQLELATLMPAFMNSDNDDSVGSSQQSQTHRPSLHIGSVLQVLTTAMTLLRRCRVNAALTIQLFSQLFHFINIWLFNRVVLEPKLQLCTRTWGNKLRKRLAHVQTWAEKQGLELAADCHLAKIIQMALVLETPKTASEMQSLLRSCDSLNSLQLRALLCNYLSAPGESVLLSDVINRLVDDVEIQVDRQLISDGREIVLNESLDLQLPFLLPEDGYSCDYVRGMPPGLTEFIDSCVQTGFCRLVLNPNASGKWTVFLINYEESPTYQNLKAGNVDHQNVGLQKPEVVVVSFNKLKNSIGLSIVAAKGDNQREKAIYVKSVVPGGAADQDGRLASGDQLLEVNGQSLIGVTQEVAAQMMAQAGQLVSLRVAKQGAVYHGLAQLLNASPQPPEAVVKSQHKQIATNDDRWRPKSEIMVQYNDEKQLPTANVAQHSSHKDGNPILRPLKQQHQARSTPTFSDLESHDSSSSVYLQQHQSTTSVTHLNSGSQFDTTHVNSISHPSLNVSSKPDRGAHVNVVPSNDSRSSMDEQDFRAGYQFELRPKSELFERQQSLDNTRNYQQNMHYSADDVSQANKANNQSVGQYVESREPKSANRPVVPSPSRQPGYATQMLFPKNQQPKPVGQVTGPSKTSSSGGLAAQPTGDTYVSSTGSSGVSVSLLNTSGYPVSLAASTAASHPSSTQTSAQFATQPTPPNSIGYLVQQPSTENVASSQHLHYGNAYQPISTGKSNVPVANFDGQEASQQISSNSVIYTVPNPVSGVGRSTPEAKSQSTVESVPSSVYKPFHAQGSYDSDFPPPPSDLLLEQLIPTVGHHTAESEIVVMSNMSLGQGFADRIQPAYSQQMYPAVSKVPIQVPAKKPPPVAAKPKLFAASISLSGEKEDVEKKESENADLTQKQMQRLTEIRRLESRPYLTANEQSRLHRLRIEEEFDRRVKESDQEEAVSSEAMSSGKQHITHGSLQQMEQPEDFSYQQRLHGKADVPPIMYERSDAQPVRPPLPSMLSYLGSVDSSKPALDTRLQLDDRNRSLNDTRQTQDQAAQSAIFDTSKHAASWPQDIHPHMQRQSDGRQQDVLSHALRQSDDQVVDQSSDNAVARQQQSAAFNYSEASYTGSSLGALKTRSASNSALKQPDSMPASTKKCVTFNENMVTEYSFNRSYGSTSSESSFPPQSPADVVEPVGLHHGVDKEMLGDVDASLLYGTQSSYPYKPAGQQYYTITGSSSATSQYK